MGCTSSKRIEATAVADVYRPAPSSFAVFDINAIEEPWLKPEAAAVDGGGDSHDEKPLPNPILEKLRAIEDAPHTWDEVSKALEDLKPNLNAAAAATPPGNGRKQAFAETTSAHNSPAAKPRTPRKSFSFHTLEELEAKISPQKNTESNRSESMLRPELRRYHSTRTGSTAESSPNVPKSLKDNIFILRDRQERENEGKPGGFVRRDPLGDFEEICPPGGAGGVVVYTTSLGGVRRTYEDCNRVRQLMETHQVVFDERDVALDGGFLTELRGLLGGDAAVPRVFVKGRYVGGAEEVVGLNEVGRLSRILNWARVERGAGRLGCAGCGGVRFVPCLGCGGSCKVVGADGKKERCGECNENGLVHCPVCV